MPRARTLPAARRRVVQPPAPADLTAPARPALPVAVAVLAPLLALYAATACPTVGPGDSGELTVAASTWGVAHAPGYPLLTLVGNLLVHALPFVEPARLLNLLNAGFAALACAVLALAVRTLTGSSAAGLVAGLALGTSRVFWLHATALEVFSLNALMAALLLLLLARWVVGRRAAAPALGVLPAAALVMSTALTHHLTLALLAIPALAVGVIGFEPAARAASGNRARWRGAIAASLLAGAIGLLPLLYIPIAARFDPPLSWGDVRDPRGLALLLMRHDFGSGLLMSPAIAVGQVLEHGESASPLGYRNFLALGTDLPRSFGWVFLLFAAIGVVWAARRARPFAALTALFVGLLALFFARANTPLTPLYQGVTERFHILPHVVLAFFGGCGIAVPIEAARRRGVAVPLAAAVAIAITALPMALAHGPRVDQHRNTFTRDFGVNLMSGMPPGAIFFASGDLFRNGFRYAQSCLGRRPDLDLVERDLEPTAWYPRQLRRRGAVRVPASLSSTSSNLPAPSREWLDLNLGPDSSRTARPGMALKFADPSYAESYRLLPAGLVSRVIRRGQPIDPGDWATDYAAAVRGWSTASLDRVYPEGSWEEREGIFYTAALAQLEGVSEIAARLGSRAPEARDVPALRAAGQWPATRRADLLAFEAAFLRECVADPPSPALARIGPWLRERATRLARASLAVDSTHLLALGTLAEIEAGLPEPNLREEVRLRHAIVERRPGDVEELTRYLRAATRLAAAGDPGALRDAEPVRRRFVRLLGICERIQPNPALVRLETQWSRPLERILEREDAPPVSRPRSP